MFRVESPRPRREHRPNCTKRPRHERKLQPRSDPAACRTPREGFSHGARQAAGPRWHLRHGPGADISTKAQMTPHLSFVHRNESWNNSFILHYWQRTILMRTLVVCSNASISCHCLADEDCSLAVGIWTQNETTAMNPVWLLFFFKYRYSVFENRYSIAKQNIAILTCIDIFLHPNFIMLYTQGFKGIVHPKMKILCLSAYPKGIQDVGDFVSSVEHKDF